MRPVCRIWGVKTDKPRRRPFLAALAAALSLFAAAPAAAAVLVSNIGQSSTTLPGQLLNNDAAQRFTTGANPNGYRLESVEMNFSTAPSGVSVMIATGLTTTMAGTTLHRAGEHVAVGQHGLLGGG